MNEAPSPAAQPESARTNLTQGLAWLVARLLSLLRARRVPVYAQLNAVECGPACLAMILSYYGRATSVGECRDVCSTSRDGASALALVQAARLFGLLARAFSLEIEHIRQLQLPAIVHWNFNHYVVVERWTPKAVTIVDPAAGRRRLTPQQFDAGFTGLALTFAPGPQLQRRRQATRSFWKVYLRPIWAASGLLGAILGTSLLLQLFGLALPAFTKLLIDHVATVQLNNALVIIGIGMLLVTVTQAMTSYMRGVLLTALQARVDAKLMQGFFQHLLSLPFSFFQQRTSGDLLMRLSSTTVIRETLTAQLLAVFLDGPLVLLYLVLLWVYAPLFAVLAIGMGALQISLLLFTMGRVHEVAQRDLLTQSEAQSYFVEVLAGMGALKASGSEDRALDHWTNLFVKQLNASVQRSRLQALVDSAMQGLRASTPLLCLLVGVQQVHDGRLSLGTMLALNTLVGAFLVPLVSLVSNGRQLQTVRAHMERLADVLHAPPEQAPALLQPMPGLHGQIVVDDLRFHYDPQALPVLHDISFAVAAGQKVALVGRTGSGKSTLLQLLLGLYPAAGGSVAYDGIPLQRLQYRTLRSQCGVVLQEPFLFSGTIRQNIAFNQPNLDLEQVIAAARIAAIHDEIMQLPMGYDTVLAEGGQGLSGGQRQRVALARAIVQHPKVLILDEATSHLDAATEAIVDAHISRLSCTRIVVAHRLSTIRNADLILVLEHGTIVERGTHERLLAQDGVYARLIASQASRLVAEQRNPDV